MIHNLNARHVNTAHIPAAKKTYEHQKRGTVLLWRKNSQFFDVLQCEQLFIEWFVANKQI